MDEPQIEERPITFPARDGAALSGLVVAPPEPRLGVLISPGTGFPKEFYRRVARAGAARGALSLIYDYRGIGGSAPADLAAMRMDYTDWGRLDMPAAIAALQDAVPGLPLRHLGHSVGGHFVGFADNQAALEAHLFVNVGLGTWWKHHRAYNPLELYFWWGYGPFSLATRGYVGAGWGGAPLPRGVFTTWRRWCHKSDYCLGELKSGLRPHHFDAVTAPITSLTFTDDPIANRRTATEFLAAYPNAPSALTVRAPADYGVSKIGHDGAFRRGREAVWEEMWDLVLG